jgi:hypothetical protein
LNPQTAPSRLRDRVALTFKILHRLWTSCGSLIALLWVVDLLFRRVVPLRIFAVRIHEPAGMAAVALPDTPGYELKLASDQDLSRATQEDTHVLSRDFVESALRKGDVCIAAYESDRIVSYAWCSSNATVAFDRVTIEIGPQYLYGYKARTSRKHRGKGLHTAGILYAAKEIAAPAGKGMVAIIEIGNDRSLVSEARAGHLKFGIALVWLGRRGIRWWLSSYARHAGLKFHADSPTAATQV